MQKERPPAPQTRLDDLLKRQADGLSQAAEAWKSFRTEIRSSEGPTRKIDELRTLNRQPSGARSPSRSFFSGKGQYGSPLRDRLGLTTLQTAPLGQERRYQSPGSRARDKFEAFYESLKLQSPSHSSVEKRSSFLLDQFRPSRIPPPPLSPSVIDTRLLIATSPKRSASPPPADDLASILALDAILHGKEILRRVGLKGCPATYISELRAFAETVLRDEDSEDN